MARYDVVVIGAGLGGLAAGAVLARAGRKVLVIERSNSVGGAASSYKSGDLFVEGSLHETSDPIDARDPKHGVLFRAGVLDAVKWIPGGMFYEARGGPLDQPFAMPDNFDAARRALTERFPQARDGIEHVLGEMERLAPMTPFERKIVHDAVAAVDGVDGIFFGPADLAASMGLLGKPGDAAVRGAMAAK